MADIPLKSFTFPGLPDKYTTPVVDNTLAVAGAAADAKKTGDEIGAIKNDLTQKADKTDALSAYIVETETGSIASFSDGADDVPVKDLKVAIEPVQSGSGDPSPTNIRPISGWTGANVTRVGKNLANIPSCTIAQAGSVYPLSPLPQALPAGTYTVGITSSAESAWVVTFRDAGNNIVGSSASNQALAGRQTKTATLSATATQVSIYVNTGTTLSDIMVEFGSTASAYEPFVDSDTVSVDWTTEAGTVYGGTLDVTTGVLTVDRAYYTTTLSTKNLLAEGAYDQYVFYSRLTGGYPVSAIEADTSIRSICNIAPYLYSNSQTSLHFYSSSDSFQVFVPSGTPETTVVEVMYFITQPQTYQLTPQEVSTILGQNNIFADAGNVTVQYRADTKLYIDKVLSA